MAATTGNVPNGLHLDGASGKATWISRTDPRVRIVFSICFACMVVSLQSLPILGVALICAIAILLSARLPLQPTLKKILAMDGFIVFLLLMLPFTTPGTEITHVAGFAVTLEGVHKAIEIALTANCIIMVLLALVATIEVTLLGKALERLKVPQKLVHLLLFSVRYIDVLKQEYYRLRTAMKARCFTATNSLHTYRSFGYLVGMLLVRSLERSERILDAMKCRGFNGQLYLMGQLRFSNRDRTISILATLYLFSMVLWGWLDG